MFCCFTRRASQIQVQPPVSVSPPFTTATPLIASAFPPTDAPAIKADHNQSQAPMQVHLSTTQDKKPDPKPAVQSPPTNTNANKDEKNKPESTQTETTKSLPTSSSIKDTHEHNQAQPAKQYQNTGNETNDSVSKQTPIKGEAVSSEKKKQTIGTPEIVGRPDDGQSASAIVLSFDNSSTPKNNVRHGSIANIPMLVIGADDLTEREREVQTRFSKSETQYLHIKTGHDESIQLMGVLERTKAALDRDLKALEEDESSLSTMNIDQLDEHMDSVRGALKKLDQYESKREQLSTTVQQRLLKLNQMIDEISANIVDFQEHINYIQGHDEELLESVHRCKEKRDMLSEKMKTDSSVTIADRLKRAENDLEKADELHKSFQSLIDFINMKLNKTLEELQPKTDGIHNEDTSIVKQLSHIDLWPDAMRSQFSRIKADIAEIKKKKSNPVESPIPKPRIPMAPMMPAFVVASEEDTSQERVTTQQYNGVLTDMNTFRTNDDSSIRTLALAARCRRTLDSDMSELEGILEPLSRENPEKTVDSVIAKNTLRSAEKKFSSFRKMVESVKRTHMQGKRGKADLEKLVQDLEVDLAQQIEKIESELQGKEQQLAEKKRLKNGEADSMGNPGSRAVEEVEIRSLDDQVFSNKNRMSLLSDQLQSLKTKIRAQLAESYNKDIDIAPGLEEMRSSFDGYISKLRAHREKVRSLPMTEDVKTDEEFEKEFIHAVGNIVQLEEIEDETKNGA